jgi:tRNA pseudouridine55 synthase
MNEEKACIFLVDKPLHWSSFDVVKYLKKILKTKVGHAGTLDPLATGLLIVCAGRWTKHADWFQKLEKKYTGTIVLGANTPTHDKESEEDEVFGIAGLNEDLVASTAQSMTGLVEQRAPDFSAKKIQGKKAYELPRKGVKPDIKPHWVEIKAFEVSNYRIENDRVLVDFSVICSKGTYIRSMAHDLGTKLGSGGYLSVLRRSAIGPYLAENALSLEDIKAKYPASPKNTDTNAEIGAVL